VLSPPEEWIFNKVFLKNKIDISDGETGLLVSGPIREWPHSRPTPSEPWVMISLDGLKKSSALNHHASCGRLFRHCAKAYARGSTAFGGRKHIQRGEYVMGQRDGIASNKRFAHMGEEVKPSKSSERIVGISPEALYYEPND
jgi:hypothetical protein